MGHLSVPWLIPDKNKIVTWHSNALHLSIMPHMPLCLWHKSALWKWNKARWKSCSWTSMCSSSEHSWYCAIKMKTGIFAQVSLLIILITAITSMWLTVGESLRWIIFDAWLWWCTVWVLTDIQHMKMGGGQNRQPNSSHKINLQASSWTLVWGKKAKLAMINWAKIGMELVLQSFV